MDLSKSGHRTPCIHSQIFTGVVEARLVVIGEDHQLVAAIANIGNVEHEVLAKFALHGEVPVHCVPGACVRRNEVGARRQRTRKCRIQNIGRVAVLRRAEASHRRLTCSATALRRNLIDTDADDARQIVGQKVLSAKAVEVNVAYAISAANDGLVGQIVSEPKARREIVAVWIDQRAIINGPLLRLNKRLCDGIEV